MQQPKPNQKPSYKILQGDANLLLHTIKPESIDTVFTSPEPPYNTSEMLQLESIILQLPRLIKPTGSIWINLGDVHRSDGTLALIPEMFVYDMVIEHDWKLRNTIIWNRASRVNDEINYDRRRFRRDHEYLYWFVKDVTQHYIDPFAFVNTTVRTVKYQEPDPAKFESGFPEDLIWQTAINTTPANGRILDPFCGTGTTGVVALESHREFLGIEANPQLIPKIKERLEAISDD